MSSPWRPSPRAELVSPYSALPAAGEDPVAAEMDRRLRDERRDPSTHRARRSMPFARVVAALDQCSCPGTTRTQQRETVAELFAAVGQADDPELECLALLRILAPGMDNRSVYGFKTTRLVRGFAKALQSLPSPARSKAAADLTRWLERPKLATGLRRGTVVALPELEISLAVAACQPQQPRAGAEAPPAVTVRDVAEFCQSLTDTYHARQRQQGPAPRPGDLTLPDTSVVDSIAHHLRGLLPVMDGLQCRVLVRVLLRTVSMGVGPQTVLSALSPTAGHFLSRQQDLARLVRSVRGTLNDAIPPTLLTPTSQLVYGVPFTPMACGQPLASPYELPWLFSQEETGGRTVKPAGGRLIILSNGQWCVPATSVGPDRNVFVGLDDPAATARPSRAPHMRLLRQMRDARLLDEPSARGFLLLYMLQTEGKDKACLLLRSLQPLAGAPCTFADARNRPEAPAPLPACEGGAAPGAAPLGQGVSRGRAARGQALGISPEEVQARLQLIAKSAHPAPYHGAHLVLRAATVYEQPADAAALTAKGVIVQTKYDGDRVVAMAYVDPATGAHVVRAFTKHGKPVHAMYSDACDELRGAAAAQPGGGCRFILDGEMILVDAAGKPLPWSGQKWRYNTGADTQRLSALMADRAGHSDDAIVTGVYDDDFVLNGTDVDNFVPFPFARLGALRADPSLAGLDSAELRARIIPGARLRYVVFDILAHDLLDLAAMPCQTRLEHLRSPLCAFLRNDLRHVQIMTDWAWVQTANELRDRLAASVAAKEEGVVVKHPGTRYVFGPSSSLRKLKVRGPDFNTTVVGVGFTLANSPRMWCLLTAVHTDERAAHIAYCRVESLEGDQQGEAARHIHAVPASVCVADLGRATRDAPLVVAGYSVHLTVPLDRDRPNLATSVMWTPLADDPALPPATVHFTRGLPRDVQWLCHPDHCPFGLSVHGDLFPVDYTQSAGDTAVVSTLQTPRFPVGRAEFDLESRSTQLDTPSTIADKFKEAAHIDSFMKAYMDGRVRSLRRRPCSLARFEQARRILQGEADPSLKWPQRPPAKQDPMELTRLFEDAGYGALTDAERLALRGVPPPSQWLALQIRALPPVISDSEEGLARAAQHAAMLPRMLSTFRALKQARMQRPIVVCAAAFPSSSRGGGDGAAFEGGGAELEGGGAAFEGAKSLQGAKSLRHATPTADGQCRLQMLDEAESCVLLPVVGDAGPDDDSDGGSEAGDDWWTSDAPTCPDGPPDTPDTPTEPQWPHDSPDPYAAQYAPAAFASRAPCGLPDDEACVRFLQAQASQYMQQTAYVAAPPAAAVSSPFFLPWSRLWT